MKRGARLDVVLGKDDDDVDDDDDEDDLLLDVVTALCLSCVEEKGDEL